MEANSILAHAKALLPEIRAIREHLHAHPELSFAEFETSKFIQSKLQEWDIPFTTGWVKTGIVAELKGRNSSNKTVALRADMDALPIHEKTQTPYQSKHAGKMHACGHDAHTAMLLGALKIMSENKNELKHTVRALFQPGEEKLPGGASLMIKEGALGTPLPYAIFGQHVYPELPAGKVGFRSGMYMASTDELYFTIKGKGGHGAMPHKCIDPIYAASQVVIALQQVISRRANARTPSVLSIGRFEGLGATNVIPSEVQMEGTFRTFDENWRAEAHQLIAQIARDTCRANGAEIDVEIRKGYPVLHNDEALTARARRAAEELLGKENVIDLDLRPTAEDFAYYTQHIPGCFYRIGTAGKDGSKTRAVHHPEFDLDPASLQIGTAMLVQMALLG